MKVENILFLFGFFLCSCSEPSNFDANSPNDSFRIKKYEFGNEWSITIFRWPLNVTNKSKISEEFFDGFYLKGYFKGGLVSYDPNIGLYEVRNEHYGSKYMEYYFEQPNSLVSIDDPEVKFSSCIASKYTKGTCRTTIYLDHESISIRYSIEDLRIIRDYLAPMLSSYDLLRDGDLKFYLYNNSREFMGTPTKSSLLEGN